VTEWRRLELVKAERDRLAARVADLVEDVQRLTAANDALETQYADLLDELNDERCRRRRLERARGPRL
jgi:cell division protein FtsB